jgi:molybdate transport system ATP-binding protein
MDVPRGTTRLAELREGRVQRVAPLRRAALGALAPAPIGPRRHPAARAARTPRRASRGRLLLRLVNADLYVGYRPVLRGIDWALRAGEHWAVTGANGAGKSSFLKLLYGDLSPALGGRIERRGFPGGTPIEAWKRRVGFVSPELQADYLVDVSIFDLVASGRHASIGLGSAPTAADRRSARRWLRFFRLASLARRRPRELSYGQLRRALLARALAGGPRLLLLDEPVTGLDPRQRASIRRLLERLMARGLTVVIAVHHPEDLPRGITRTLHLCRRTAIQVVPRARSSS